MENRKGLERKPSRLEWECPQCHSTNSATNKVCEKCQYPEVVLEAKQVQQLEQHERDEDEKKGKQKEEKELGWGCDLCTFHNSFDVDQCEICFTPRKFKETKEEPEPSVTELEHEHKGEPWECPRCTYLNPWYFKICEICEYNQDLATSYEAEKEEVQEVVKAIKDESDWFKDLASQSVFGSHVVGSDHVVFQVWSPNASQVFVTGPFNNWKEKDSAFELTRDEQPERGNYFVGSFSGIKEDSEYKFVIKTKKGATLWRNDPRALCFTSGKYNINSKIFNATSFQWSDFPPPKWEKMVLYEMHIASFTEKGTFRSAVDSFEYLASLGINSLALMPINQDHHTLCWGYDPVSLFAIHGPFGTPGDLQYFVDEAHKRGMSVILDWIPNHMSPKNVLNKFDSISSDNDGVFFYMDEKVKTGYGPKLNYSEPAVRQYIKDSVRLFLEYFHFDGIRVDSTVTMRRQFVGKEEQNLEAWTLMQEINDMVHIKMPGKIMIAEDLQGNRRINYPLGGFDSQWDDRFFSTLFTNAIDPSDNNRNLNQLADAICHSYHSYIHNRVIYTENHDTIPNDRQKRLPEAICQGTGDKNFFAIKRSVLCAGILFTSPGIPMILQGQELLETSCPVWPHPPSVDWSRKSSFRGIFDLYRQLIALRLNKFNSTKGLTSPHVAITHMNHHGKVIAYHRYEFGGPGDDVIVIVNFSNSIYKEYVIGFPRQGRWRILFNSDWSSYSNLFENVGATLHYVDTVPKSYDGFFFSGSLMLGRYSMLILSIDP